MQQLPGMAVQQKYLMALLQIIQMQMIIVFPTIMTVAEFVMVEHLLVSGMQIQMVMV